MVWTGMHHVRSGQLRSGQVRVFNVDIQSKLLQRTSVTAQGVKGGGSPALPRNKREQAIPPESVAGGGCFEVLWNLECPVELNQKRNMCAFQ